MRSNLQIWAAGLATLSFVLAIGWAWLQKRQRYISAWPVFTGQGPKGAARFFYFVGLPYLALVSGILTTRLLGLKGLEYFGMVGFEPDSSLPSLLADLQSALVLMLLEWFVDSSVTIVVGLVALLILGGVWLGLARAGVRNVSAGPPSGLDILYDGLHWSFYRAIFWLLTGDLYLGVVLGVVVVSVEGVLGAWLAGNWPVVRQPLPTNGTILILTATVFFYSPNLWLLWPVHGAMVLFVHMVTVNLNDSKLVLSEQPGHR